MSLADDKCLIAQRMERLSEMRDDGDITERDFKRQYGPLARALLGDKEYEHTRKRKRVERRRRARSASRQAAEQVIGG